MKNRILLECMASDLKRVALGIQRKSYAMATRFEKEALERSRELDIKDLPQYIQKLLSKMEASLSNNDNSRKAEDALMYSTLFQNYVVSTRHTC